MLCDTNIISELAKPNPNQGVLDWSQDVSSIVISVITLEEIMYGLTAKSKPKIEVWFQSFLQVNCSVLPITPEIALHAGKLRGKLRQQGQTRT